MRAFFLGATGEDFTSELDLVPDGRPDWHIQLTELPALAITSILILDTIGLALQWDTDGDISEGWVIYMVRTGLAPTADLFIAQWTDNPVPGNALTVRVAFSDGSFREAQTILGGNVTIDIIDDKLGWDWSLGTGGPIDGFRIKYGLASGVYTQALTIPDPAARSVLASQLNTLGVGPYFAVIVSTAGIVESPPSNEITFDFATVLVPAAPTNFRILVISA